MMAHRWGIAVIAGFMACHASGLLAQNTYYQAASGNWTNALNWSDGVPDETKNAYIGRAGHATPATVTLDTAGAKALSLTLGWLEGDQGTVTMTDADLAVTALGGFNIADKGVGTFNQSGGTVSVSGGNGARIGIATPSHGTYTLDNNGQLTSTILAIGVNAGSTGTVEVAGSQISLSGYGGLSVGNKGYGSMNQSGGTVRAADDGWNARIGNDAGSQGFYTLSGGVFSFPDLNVGRAGTGVWMQTGGSVTNSTLMVGVVSGAVGTYTLNDGTNVINYVFHVGREGGIGFLNLNGGSLTQNASTETTIGHKGTGTVTQTGGRLTGNWSDGHFLTLGNEAAGVGTYQISGGTLENCSIKNGVSGSGTFEVVGDSAVIDLGRFIQNAASLLSFKPGTGGAVTPIQCRSGAYSSSLDGSLLVDLRDVDKSVTDGTLTLIDYSATPAHNLSGTFSSVTIRSRYGNNLLTPGTQGRLGSKEYYLDYGDGPGEKVTLEWSDKPTGTVVSIR